MNIQPESAHSPPFVDIDRERGGTHDKDGFVLSAHRGKSQGRPRTTPSSQLISHDGLPDRVSQQSPLSPRDRSLTAGPDAVSSPDNGPGYLSIAHAAACRALRIKHLRTRAYRPRTNGKAERFIRTLLAGWAYGAIYRSSTEREAALSGWLDFYNRRRPHGSLGHKPPLDRLTALQQGNNLVGSYN
jgi:transposase InsO family protein